MADDPTAYVVDDEEPVRDSLRLLLTVSGYRVQCFADARSFLAELGGLRAGCVLLDINLPRVDGFEVLRQLAESATDIPAIVLSGHGETALALRAIRAGAVDFLQKPFEKATLLRALGKATDRIGLDPATLRRIAADAIAGLDSAERDVLAGLCAQVSDFDLAQLLSLSPDRLALVREKTLRKLQAANLAQAIRLAVDAGFPSETLTWHTQANLFD